MQLIPTPFLEGSIIVYQPKKGFRFGIDSILLAHFLNLKPQDLVLEVGAGSGIISLIALKRFPKAKIFALELESIFIECLKRNILENKLQEKLFIIKGDIKTSLFKSGIFDVIFSNPPYFKSRSGRKSPYEIENIARRDVEFELDEFLKKVSSLLKNKGKFYLVFTALRLAELIYLLKKNKLEPKLLRLVYSYPGSEAKLVLLLAVKNAKEEIRILSPLYIYNSPKGNYTEEVKNMLGRLEEN
ncbi:MAG: tRNA1 A37 N6-methylase TrmN6 [Thermodesulfobacteria bacterium]|nr:methyltransferase [Thermodesulfobacteriota bacterium]MCU4137627.1 tRNA1 A37 N6-methylase TrmN6 [Thermodesulfobacteriota bacterium]